MKKHVELCISEALQQTIVDSQSRYSLLKFEAVQESLLSLYSLYSTSALFLDHRHRCVGPNAWVYNTVGVLLSSKTGRRSPQTLFICDSQSLSQCCRKVFPCENVFFIHCSCFVRIRPMSGQVVRNDKYKRRFRIEHNNAGVEFIEAYANVKLSSLKHPVLGRETVYALDDKLPPYFEVLNNICASFS